MRRGLLLGAHMSIAGGVDRALERGASIDCAVVQIFTRNQTRWLAPDLRDEEVARFRSLAPGFAAVFAHSSYLLNLASPTRDLWQRSITGLAEELRRCRILRLPFLVMHPGACAGSTVGEGIRRVAEGIRRATARSATLGSVEVALESTAGSGSILGSRFEELRDLLERLETTGIGAGICLDTCHVFAAGYDIRTPEGYEATWEAFDRIVGRPRLRAVHLNDSKRELGSRVDRHEHIGKGMIGREGFRLFVRDRSLRGVPMCIETPAPRASGPDAMRALLRADARNLAVLRGLARVR